MWITVSDDEEYEVQGLLHERVVYEHLFPYFIVRSPICNTLHIRVFINLQDLRNFST